MNEEKNIEACDFVDGVFADALRAGASDIYWLPSKNSYSIRFRINGLQKTIQTIPREYGDRCVSRIKVLAGLLTYRTKISQDGAIKGFAKFADAELRAASMPTIHGERLTVRILNGKNGFSSLDQLGFQDDALHALRKMLERPDGLIILTGPTGCGKTTTIYGMIRELLRNSQDPASIISIEDPVECEIDGISQVSLSRAGEEWSYPEALRAALRQDVKTLVIGEMRDKEVVRVALDASLTGHRVMASYHAGDIPSVYARILHCGFEPFLAASAISGIFAQRLVPGKDGTRIPIASFLTPDDEWRDFIIRNPGLCELRKKASETENADIRHSAEKMFKKGLISEKDLYLV